MNTKKHLPSDIYLQIENLPLLERIENRGGIHFQPGDKKFSTKNEMGDIAHDLNRFYKSQKQQ